MATLTAEQRLVEAEDAYHALATGAGVAEVRDQNGEMIRYNKADLAKLAQYIEALKAQIAGTNIGSGPLRISA